MLPVTMPNKEKADWEFVYEGPTEDFPLGYYHHKPSDEKYCFKRGIVDKVGKEKEFDIYNTWWYTNC
jgi:hypothetical protein